VAWGFGVVEDVGRKRLDSDELVLSSLGKGDSWARHGIDFKGSHEGIIMIWPSSTVSMHRAASLISPLLHDSSVLQTVMSVLRM